MMCERWFAVVSFTTEDRKAAARRAALPSLQARENYNPTFRFPSIVPASAQRGHRAAPGGELGPPAKQLRLLHIPTHTHFMPRGIVY